MNRIAWKKTSIVYDYDINDKNLIYEKNWIMLLF